MPDEEPGIDVLKRVLRDIADTAGDERNQMRAALALADIERTGNLTEHQVLRVSQIINGPG